MGDCSVVASKSESRRRQGRESGAEDSGCREEVRDLLSCPFGYTTSPFRD